MPKTFTKGALLAITSTTSDVPGRIARAAASLFSRQGYHGTSTREIARLADVSEVTVFRHFERKEDIFLSALQFTFGNVKGRLDLLGHDAARIAPEAMLPQILSVLVDIATFSPELTKLVAVAFLELHGKAEDFCFQHLTPLFTSITAYLSTNMQKGSFRSLNPSIATAAMALTALAQPELSKLLTGSAHPRMAGRDSIDEYVKFWMKVFTPATN
jgi:AcrR family transcriptional regulator